MYPEDPPREHLGEHLGEHLDEEQIQRFVHGELPPTTRARSHLAECADCRSRVAEAERQETRVLDLLRHLDDPAPSVRAATIVAASGKRGARGPQWGRWAAGILLALAVAGGAYAAPGSPLRALVGRLVSRPERPAPRAPALPAAPAGTDDISRGIAVAPGARFTIAFSSAQPGGVATVALTDRADVLVRALSGVAIFTADVDRLAIDNSQGAARFEIEIPRGAPNVEVRVGGRRVFSKDASHVTAEGERDAQGRYLVPLSDPPPSRP